MMGVGPFSIHVVIVAVAVVLAWSVARLIGKRLPDGLGKTAGGMIFDAVLVGLAAARLGYIAQWWPEYAQAPLSMLAIGDGGFTWWLGVPVALAFVWWRTRGARTLRQPVIAGIFTGMVAWGVGGGVVSSLQRAAPPLPDVALATLDARPITLKAYAGKPVVLNLWVTWCPPCRREMPVFAAAQQELPGVAFVMVNQGETASAISAFLERENLVLRDVLRDPSSLTMREMRARGLPTTLFFDADGRLVDAHMGEMTMASLKSTITRRFAQSSQDQ
ncbi:TPA: prolipoprotein diacylglyceryl transferase family protein [Stenotrophomonas maltophilia]|jgi:thiol-disulfide isomerase/thioredoxin|uniref:TlpA disulfide reductase family protein n=1 Tax=Burkholderia sp. LMG 13014 TaxID=2709306 RepID=UPI001966AE8E|nr:TlpA disulfide reductase family protein [Burkholderia sp. LMG 13014]HDS1367955.1 TlpA family protein disulfide reductase [Stenotrophomonas maltophilia]HEJ3239994.1 TlpA family protein disulfide reductase [Pseudomonas aeruginosa]HDS1372569.1 TlpA family protein disulfide reductase [Stenotrophomonas maltophilia]HDS1376494.1 TlpA family protein disulfide reductase [Stenotrophomonas maltophilia]HDS1381348.1 TlpA family protein disulfide reductase [Stenotrophomonas maltophilia]